MKTSENINELAAALSRAQSVMTGAKKGSDNPFFKSKYSDLSQVMEAISMPFAENGLSFVQAAEFEDNRIAVTTRIMHLSGQWIQATTALPPTKQDAQGYGSAISYAKRYGLQALAGVPSVDDDGNDAVKLSNVQPSIELDQDVIAKFESCTTLDQLKEVWGSLTNEQRHVYAGIKNKTKARL
ncbi:MAG: ERF family protein [Gammaproteobacteria bacterium]|nr:ERF family protein [Gammaproteobacteria bacterium]